MCMYEVWMRECAFVCTNVYVCRAARPGKKEGIQGPSWFRVPQNLSFWKVFALAISLAVVCSHRRASLSLRTRPGTRRLCH